MIKKLKIRFVKLESYLVAQQLEMTGKEHFTLSEHVALLASGIDFADAAIWLSRSCNFNIGVRCFRDNAERDEYLDKVIKWISEEQFWTGRKLEIGKFCSFSDDGKRWTNGEYAGKCDAQLGEPRFLAGCPESKLLARWKYVFPFEDVRLRIDGDVYTWEMEVAE